MSEVINLIGKRFGRLTVICRNGSNEKGRSMWECICDCGNKVTVIGYSLKCGNTKSCGCLKLEKLSRVGGITKHLLYDTWRKMIARCENPKAHEYDNYGGRGIKVCDRWLHSFKNFLEDMGERPEGMTLDRIDVNGNYEPGNCRWATSLEQNNNRKDNLEIIYSNIRYTTAHLARKTGVSNRFIERRVHNGFTSDEIINDIRRKVGDVI